MQDQPKLLSEIPCQNTVEKEGMGAALAEARAGLSLCYIPLPNSGLPRYHTSPENCHQHESPQSSAWTGQGRMVTRTVLTPRVLCCHPQMTPPTETT